jgi:hypothetical protein
VKFELPDAEQFNDLIVVKSDETDLKLNTGMKNKWNHYQTTTTGNCPTQMTNTVSRRNGPTKRQSGCGITRCPRMKKMERR